MKTTKLTNQQRIYKELACIFKLFSQSKHIFYFL